MLNLDIHGLPLFPLHEINEEDLAEYLAIVEQHHSLHELSLWDIDGLDVLGKMYKLTIHNTVAEKILAAWEYLGGANDCHIVNIHWTGKTFRVTLHPSYQLFVNAEHGIMFDESRKQEYYHHHEGEWVTLEMMKKENE